MAKLTKEEIKQMVIERGIRDFLGMIEQANEFVDGALMDIEMHFKLERNYVTEEDANSWTEELKTKFKELLK